MGKKSKLSISDYHERENNVKIAVASESVDNLIA